MSDPIIVAAAAVGWQLSKRTANAMERLFGPAADEIAKGLAQRIGLTWLGRGGDILERADAMSADVEGAVHGRVAVRVVEEGSTCDDPLMAHYFAGVLASSKGVEPDDSGTAWAALLGRLPTDQIKLHFAFHRALLDASPSQSLGIESVRERHRVFLPFSDLFTSMGLPLERTEHSASRVQFALTGLLREDLVGPPYGLCTTDNASADMPSWCRHSSRWSEGGVYAEPTLPGIELFMRGQGWTLPVAAFTDGRFSLSVSPEAIAPQAAAVGGGA